MAESYIIYLTYNRQGSKQISLSSLKMDSARSIHHLPHSQPTVPEADLTYLTHNGYWPKHTSLTSLKAYSAQSIPHSEPTVLEAHLTYRIQSSLIAFKSDGARRRPHAQRIVVEAYIIYLTHNRRCSKPTSLISLKIDSVRSIPHLPHSKLTMIDTCVIQNEPCGVDPKQK